MYTVNMSAFLFKEVDIINKGEVKRKCKENIWQYWYYC